MPAFKNIIVVSLSATIAFSPALRAQQFSNSAEYESSRQAELEMRVAYTECRLEGRSEEQCRAPSLADEDQQRIREMADEIDRRAAVLYEQFPELEETISGATEGFSRVIRECAEVTVNEDGTTGETCLEETFNDATTALGNAARTARQVCDALPNADSATKNQCSTAVDEFTSSANQEMEKFLSAMAPVLAFCAASAGTGCALMAIAAIISLFLDSGGGSGDNGSDNGDRTANSGNQQDPNPDDPGQAVDPVRANDAFDDGGEWTVRDAGSQVVFSRGNDNFSISGFYREENGEAKFVSVNPNPATDAIIAEVQQAGSIADFIARNALDHEVPPQKFVVVEVDQSQNGAAYKNFAIQICAAREPGAGTGTGEPHVFLRFLQRRSAGGAWEYPILAAGRCTLARQ
ncbi:hypothetical protein [Fluviibacterium sp. S390]|uniref:hypothetical protein n=1 Tax=Fluviibacterium sp. S390 TaxID=3415139 RepID=UPI003C7EC8C1